MQDTSVVEVAARDLDVALREPFGIATGAQLAAENLLVRVRLACGAVGYGEAAPFPAFNGETRAHAREAVARVAPALRGWDARRWRALGPWLSERIVHAASARCAVETAVLDALARAWGAPLWALFGGHTSTLESDMTVTTGTAEAARAAATTIAREGFRTVKLKVGGVPRATDEARVRAVVEAAPGCGLLLDANGGMASVQDAVALVRAAQGAGGTVVLFEQPMGERDLAGLRAVGEQSGVPVAADESVASARDVVRVAREGAAGVINVKLMKSGVAEALDVVAAARAHGLGLMVGGMVESSLAMTMSACLAAGQGGFDFVDLDTPLFLAEEPFEREGTQRGPRIELGGIRAGHGVTPRAGWSETDR